MKILNELNKHSYGKEGVERINRGNRKGKLIVVYMLIAVLGFSFLFPGDLEAKAPKKGVELTVTKKDDTVIQGELLAVKDTVLVVMTTSEAEASVDISEVKAIKMKRANVGEKSFLIGSAVGFGIGALAMAPLAYQFDHEDKWLAFKHTLLGGVGGLMLGAIVGALVGATAKEYKNIKFEDKDSMAVREILEKLNKKARYRN